MDEVGRLLNAVRAQAGLTQRQLAQRSGLSQPTITRLERLGGQFPLRTLARAVEPLGLKPRVVLEPLDSLTDAEIDALLQVPPSERLAEVYLNWERLTETMAGLPFRVGGAAAARLHGAPVPLEDVELVLAEADLPAWSLVLQKLWAKPWLAAEHRYDGVTCVEPEGLGTRRWLTLAGHLSASYRPQLPAGPVVEVAEGVPVEVLPVHELVGDAEVQRALERVWQRIASDP